MHVIEIFSSLQGEGSFTGFPTTFIRLAGCNLANLHDACVWCDTKYAYENRGTKMHLGKIMKQVEKFPNKYVCITGGEPLIQEEVYSLVYELQYNGYKVSIETNGSIPIENPSVPRSYSYVMDIKLFNSRPYWAKDRNCYSNIRKLKKQDDLKFVVATLDDFKEALHLIEKYPTYANIWFYSVDGDTVLAKKIAEELIKSGVEARLGIHTHRVLKLL